MMKEKVKKHLKEHKNIYILASIQIAIGVVTYKLLSDRIEELSIGETVINTIEGGTNNRIKYQAISMYGNVLGRPGIPVIAEHAGRSNRYESISLAAQAIGASSNAIRNQLHGLKDNVNGYTFKFAE